MGCRSCCFFKKIVLSSKLDQEGSALSLVGRALVSKTKGRWFESNSAWSSSLRGVLPTKLATPSEMNQPTKWADRNQKLKAHHVDTAPFRGSSNEIGNPQCGSGSLRGLLSSAPLWTHFYYYGVFLWQKNQ